jgi:hypothetical protein
LTRATHQPRLEPDEKLVARYASKCRWNAEKLREVFQHFGPLSGEAQETLARGLERAFASYQSLGENVRRIPASATAKRIGAIESESEKLALRLGIKVKRIDWRVLDDLGSGTSASQRLGFLYDGLHCLDPLGVDGREALIWLALARVELPRAFDVSSPDNPALKQASLELRRNSEEVAEAVLGLIWLYRQAEAARNLLESRRTTGQGGAENPLTANGLLIAHAFEVWAAFSGETTIGYGGPLVRFVVSVATLFGAQIADNQVKNAWRTRDRRLRMQKEKSLP